MPDAHDQLLSQFRDLRLNGTRGGSGPRFWEVLSRLALLPAAAQHAALRGARLLDLAMHAGGPNRSSESVQGRLAFRGKSRSPATSSQRHSISW